MNKQQRTQAKITIAKKAVNSKEQEIIRRMLKEPPESRITYEERQCLEKIFK